VATAKTLIKFAHNSLLESLCSICAMSPDKFPPPGHTHVDRGVLAFVFSRPDLRFKFYNSKITEWRKVFHKVMRREESLMN